MGRPPENTNRVNCTTTIDEDLWTKLRFLSLYKKCNMNDLLEEGIECLLDKYQSYLPKELRPKSSTKNSKSIAK